LPKLWFNVYESAHYEADDVIATMVERHNNRFDEVFVRTWDSDMYQLITDKVKILKSDKIFWIPELKIKFDSQDFLPLHYVLHKSLIGDKSDNVAGIDKVGPKTALKILTECWFDYNRVIEHEKVKDFKELIERNIQVIWLNKYIEDDKLTIFEWISNVNWIENELASLWIKSLSSDNFYLNWVNAIESIKSKKVVIEKTFWDTIPGFWDADELDSFEDNLEDDDSNEVIKNNSIQWIEDMIRHQNAPSNLEIWFSQPYPVIKKTKNKNTVVQNQTKLF
jgi:5'-3' exonuclease